MRTSGKTWVNLPLAAPSVTPLAVRVLVPTPSPMVAWMDAPRLVAVTWPINAGRQVVWQVDLVRKVRIGQETRAASGSVLMTEVIDERRWRGGRRLFGLTGHDLETGMTFTESWVWESLPVRAGSDWIRDGF